MTGTETAAGSTTTPSHVANPFTGAGWYVNPNYTSEVATSVAGASGTLASQMTLVGQQSTGVWLDHIGAIYGGSDNSSRMSLQAQLANAAGSTSPVIVPIVVYDLPNRDCAALASNGELTVANNGLQYYEQDYINPIAQILTDYEHTNIRVVAIIEPDSLPNLVTNLSDANCAQANSSGAYVKRHPVRAQQAARDPERLQLRRHRALGVARLVLQHGPGGHADSSRWPARPPA